MFNVDKNIPLQVFTIDIIISNRDNERPDTVDHLKPVLNTTRNRQLISRFRQKLDQEWASQVDQ